MSSRRKNNNKSTTIAEITANPKEGRIYGLVKKPCGDKRFACEFVDQKENEADVIAKLTNGLGKGPNKQYIRAKDFVLLMPDTSTTTVKDDGSKKYFIIYKYNKDEIKQMKKMDNDFKRLASNELCDLSDIDDQDEQHDEIDDEVEVKPVKPVGKQKKVVPVAEPILEFNIEDI